MCDSLISKGFDMIIGSGPHIEQPVEMIGDTLVAWSLGNFLSSHEGYNADKPNEGIMLEVNIGEEIDWQKINIKTENNKIVIQ
jgi:poly-gamma-glutamate capsule biosynthesis protein CapA/YwtB (metallophosphatase superfamily)